MIGHFVCRCCGEPGAPAHRNAHACIRCWREWEALQEELLAQPAGATRKIAHPPVSGNPPPAASLSISAGAPVSSAGNPKPHLLGGGADSFPPACAGGPSGAGKTDSIESIRTGPGGCFAVEDRGHEFAVVRGRECAGVLHCRHVAAYAADLLNQAEGRAA